MDQFTLARTAVLRSEASGVLITDFRSRDLESFVELRLPGRDYSFSQNNVHGTKRPGTRTHLGTARAILTRKSLGTARVIRPGETHGNRSDHSPQ